MPLAVYLARETDPGASITLSLLLLGISIVVLAVVGSRVFGRPA
jgi:ABC-type sulfate transport system permease component